MSNQQASSSSTRNPNAGETFHNFFQGWLSEEKQLLSDLKNASKSNGNNNNNDVQLLTSLVSRAMNLCERYYQAKSDCSRKNAWSGFNPKWKTTLEMAYIWVGGWRPTMAIQLLYSKSSLQLEATFHEILAGLPTFDLGALSMYQFVCVDALHKEIVDQEREITQMRAKRLYSVVDSSMVDLSHTFVGFIDGSERVVNMKERVQLTLRSKRVELEDLVRRADDLRLGTIRALVEILTPLQSVHFFIAAAELHLTFHEWGMRKDAERREELN